MKSLLLGFVILGFGSTSFAADKFFCAGNDGSDLSIAVNLKTKKAKLQGEDVDTTYSLSGVLESMPPQYVFGNMQECKIIFKPSRDENSGRATFSCNAEKFPNALDLDFPCSAE